jgi:hypothetical protein|nr:MAG TPA: hypothetical protein [Caudoviricetes sp.]
MAKLRSVKYVIFMRKNFLFSEKISILAYPNKDNNMSKNKRTFQQIARDIKSTWLNVYFGAVPYLEALLTLDTTDPNAMYYYDTAGDIVRYFLANAQTFRGADANKLKAELKSML